MNAKEMFEDLGYYLDIETNEEQIVYSKDILDKNTFCYLDSEIIIFEKDNEAIYFTNKDYLTKCEVEAIQQQISELGWESDGNE